MAERTCQTARTATGRIAGPLRPPVTPPSWGRSRSVSMTIPSSVLIIVSPVAPALTAAWAMPTMSVTSGVSLAKMGMSCGSCSRTRATTLADAIGSHAKTRPRLATLGQEMLTSTPRRRRMPRWPAGWPRRRRTRRSSTRRWRPGPRPGPLEPGQVGPDKRLDARALEADGVQHPRRCLGHPGRAAAGARCRHDRLRHECPELGDIEEAVQLPAVRRAAGRGHHRAGQDGPGEVDGATTAGAALSRSAPRLRRPHRRPSVPGG